MSFVSGFKSLPRLVQIILLLIPGVNWITEVLVRGSAFLHGKATEQVIVLILAIIPGYRRNPRLGRPVLLLAAEETYFDLTFRLLRTKRPDLPSGLFVFRQARKKLKKYYFNFGRASCVAIKTRAGVSLMPPSIHSSSGPNTAPPYSRAR